ncbi:MAG: LytTR family transcriptional regulator [Paludibacteraceae bacterium]|nr:LytTR family transcriptional regulator [Paludibacteraceae bacterium]
MNSKVPGYMYEKSNIIRLVLLTAAFALLFINIFQPFNSRGWYPNISEFKYFFFSSLIILTGMLVVVISRMIMHSYTKKHDLVYWQYALYVAGEVLAMSLFYTLFSIFVPRSENDRDILEIFYRSTKNTGLVLLLPYSILWLYFSWREKNNMLKKLTQEELAIPGIKKKPMIAFPDEKGEIKISVMIENLLYVDSADNYATIHYLNKSKLSHFLIRNSLKWIEENLTKETPLVRCHRSFIVNLDMVKVLRKTKEGIFLEMDALNTPDIPVSKTYYDRVMDKFSKYSV